MARKIHLGVDDVSRNVKGGFVGSPKEKIKNIIKNGSLSENTLGWTLDENYYTFTQNKGYLHIEATQTATGGTRPNYQFFDKVVGSLDESENQILYACAMIRGYETNTSYPRVYMGRHLNGSETMDFGPNLEPHNSNVNNGWYLVSARFQTYQSSTTYYDYDRIAFGISTTTAGDKMDICNVMLFNLTKTFGRGQEPTKAQCDEYLSWKFINLINNGSLQFNCDGWALSNATTSNDGDGIKLTATSTNRPTLYQYFNNSIGGTSTNNKIFACVKVKGKPTNTSYPIMSISGSPSGTYQYASPDGKSKSQLNDGEWHFLRMYLNTVSSNSTQYTYNSITLMTTYESGYTPTEGDEYYFKDACVYNLTEIFGSGYEPDDTWCINNLQNPRFNINKEKSLFTTNVFPRSWTVSQDNTSATASNELGDWKITLNREFEDFTTLFNEVYTASIRPSGRNNTKIIIQAPIEINPQSMYIKYENMPPTYITALNKYSSSWDELKSLTTGSSLISTQATIDTDLIYSKYCVDISPEASSGSVGDLYAFEIRTGYIIDAEENIKIDEAIQKPVARKIIEVYNGVNNIARKSFCNRYEEFVHGILPNNFELTAGYYKAQATNKYGIWKVESSNTGLTQSNSITNIFGGFYTGSISITSSSGNCYITIDLPNCVHINPTEFCLIATCASNNISSDQIFMIQGYDDVTSTWYDLINYRDVFNGSSLSQKHYFHATYSGSTYYSKFRMHVTRGSGVTAIANIYDFQIKKGYIKY